MKKLFVILIICLLTYSSFCQDRNTKWDVTKNSIYFELAGNGLLFSINYERLFPLGEYTGLATRIGFAEAVDIFDGTFHPMLPLEINFIFGKRHCLEFGVGPTFDLGLWDGERVYAYFGRAGYRYRGDNGFLFRFAPMLANEVFWLGMSIGYSF